jgi:hypothetical protein
MLSFNGRGSSNQNIEPLIVVDGIPMNTGTGGQPSSTGSSNNIDNQSNQAIENQNAESATSRESTINRPNQYNSTSNEDKFSQTNSQLKAKDLVGHITVEYVSRVEIYQRGDARYGSASSNGVIAIFTLKAPRIKEVNSYDSYVVQGYAKPKPFMPATLLSLDKAYNPATLYWNPSITLTSSDETKLSFEAPNNSGQYVIRIEGISAKGNPVSGSIIFNLEKPSDQTKARF